MILCKNCGNIDDDYDFIYDYVWDDELDDEVSWCKCPSCRSEDQDYFEDYD